jgi:hypothetical protein
MKAGSLKKLIYSGAAIVALAVVGCFFALKTHGPHVSKRQQTPIVATNANDDTAAITVGSSSPRQMFGVPRPAKQASVAGLDPQLDPAHFSFGDMQDRWRSEADDPEWTMNAREFVRAILDPPDDGGGASIGLACRKTLCRIEASSQDMGELLKLARESASAQASFRYSRVPKDGGVDIVAYVWRTNLTRNASPIASP